MALVNDAHAREASQAGKQGNSLHASIGLAWSGLPAWGPDPSANVCVLETTQHGRALPPSHACALQLRADDVVGIHVYMNDQWVNYSPRPSVYMSSTPVFKNGLMLLNASAPFPIGSRTGPNVLMASQPIKNVSCAGSGVTPGS